MPNLENLYLMGTYEELLNVRGIFYDVRDKKVHRKMCNDLKVVLILSQNLQC